MFGYKTQNRTVLLQIICIYLNIFICHCENLEAIINLRYEATSSNYLQARILESNYERLKDYFFDISTKQVKMRYGWGLEDDWKNLYILDVEKHGNTDKVMFFRCFVIRSASYIQCQRNVKCYDTDVDYCPKGFGIAWFYNGEYLISEHLQNSTVDCNFKTKVTCYTLINVNPPTRTVISPTTTSSKKVNTDAMTTTRHSTESTVTMIPTSLYTISSENSSLTSAAFSKNHSTEITSLDSTAVIAGSTVAVVIILIIFVIVIVTFMKRKVKKLSTRNKDMPKLRLPTVENSFNGSGNNQQTLNLHEPVNTKSSRSKVTTNEQYIYYNSTNANNYTNMQGECKIRDSVVPHSIYECDYTGIDEDQTPTLPDGLLSADEDKGSYYNTICSNQGFILSKPEAQDIENGNSSIERNNFVANNVHPDSYIDVNAIVYNDVGYKNFKEILENANTAAVNEYNTITEDNTTIGKTEPVKKVYSEFRENIRHFENTYVNLGGSMLAGEDNTTQAGDNTYFILEAEENGN